MMVDIKAFYGNLPPERASGAALYAGLPLWVVRMAFAGYAFHRHLGMGRVLGGAITPEASIVAGDTLVMYVVAAFRAVGLASFPEPRAVRRMVTGYVEH